MNRLQNIASVSLISVASSAFGQSDAYPKENPYLNSYRLDTSPISVEETTAFWAHELQWIGGVYGFTRDPVKRAKNLLGGYNRSWVEQEDKIAEYYFIDPALRQTVRQDEINAEMATLGALGDILFNAGTTVLFFDKRMPEIRSNAEAWGGGEYNSYSDHITIDAASPNPMLIKHELAHAVDENFTFINRLYEALMRDYGAIQDSNVDIPDDLSEAAEVVYRSREGRISNDIFLYIAKTFFDMMEENSEYQSFFPNSYDVLDTIKINEMHDVRFKYALSGYHRIWTNFSEDLHDLVRGEADNDARLTVREGVVIPPPVDLTMDITSIIAQHPITDEEIKINLHPTVAEYIQGHEELPNAASETFAEIFANAIDGCEVTELCHYFPRTTNEILGIINAIDILAESEQFERQAEARYLSGPQ